MKPDVSNLYEEQNRPFIKSLDEILPEDEAKRLKTIAASKGIDRAVQELGKLVGKKKRFKHN